jgi:alkylation response protein AidB-like acyl-CoA dehydrogenase
VAKVAVFVARLRTLISHVQGRRFAATLGELTGGRVGLTCGSVGVLKGAVTIAIRYSAGRQQFGPPDSPEVRGFWYVPFVSCIMVCL